MRKFWLFLVVTCLSSAFIFGFKAYTNTTYFGTTDEPVKICWDHSAPATVDEYIVVLYHVEQQVEAFRQTTQQNCLEIQLPRSGHYVAIVSAQNSSGESEPARSDDPEATHNQPWWIYGHIAPAGVLSIGGK